MGTLEFLRDSYAEIGKKFVSLDFDTHPIWSNLFDQLPGCSSTAILDNTTLHNALTLMNEGLGDERSFRAALLPDLVSLFFAISHFDCILLLDHGLYEDDLRLLDEFLGEFGIITRFDWQSEMVKDEWLKSDLYLKFNAIQAEFGSITNFHQEWQDTWSTLMNQHIYRPIRFTRDIDTLLRSPEHPLHEDASELSTNWIDVINEGLPEEERYPWKSKKDRLKFELQSSTLASYHTYRSIFYFCLSEYLEIPYIPCGMRSVTTNFLPIELLQNPSDPLNPNVPTPLIILAETRSTSSNPAMQLPALRISPVFAKVIDILQGFYEPNWKETIKQIRLESNEYRNLFNEFLTACKNGYNLNRIREIVSVLTEKIEGEKELTSAVVKIGGMIKMFEAAKLDPLSTFAGLLDIVQAKPWDYLRKLTRKRHASFILNAQSLADSSLSLEEQCKRLWKRPFSTEERSYLMRMVKLKPTYGIM